MSTPLKNAVCSLPKSFVFTVFSFAALICIASPSCMFAQIRPIEDTGGGDDYYCPASQHSCDSTELTPYFPPDPFDLAAGCDRTFLDWNPYTHQPDPSSCYGACAGQDPPDFGCYAGCQDRYSGCLRNAFSLGARLVPLGSQSPGNTPNISGNVYRSCLADRIPSTFATQYQQCRAEGRAIEDCCREIANNFP